MNIKISIIIPVYNAEAHLTQCIESLLNQSLEECEFIFINDGSSDSSKEIIEMYRMKETRIKLINQINQGVSSARNKGLNNAVGEYVGFVDADDQVNYDMYKTLYEEAKVNNCDIVISNLETKIEGKKVVTTYPFLKEENLHKGYIQEEIIPYFIKSDKLNSVCNKLFKNNVITENKLEFPDNVALGEDGLFNIRFFSKAEIVRYVDYSGYYYREVEGSATRNISKKDYFTRSLEVYKLSLPNEIITNLDEEKVQKLKSIKLITSVMSYIHVYFKPSKDLSFKKRYQYIKRMIKNKNVIESLPRYYHEHYQVSGNYEKFIIRMIKIQSTIGLYFATTYSRMRNK